MSGVQKRRGASLPAGVQNGVRWFMTPTHVQMWRCSLPTNRPTPGPPRRGTVGLDMTVRLASSEGLGGGFMAPTHVKILEVFPAHEPKRAASILAAVLGQICRRDVGSTLGSRKVFFFAPSGSLPVQSAHGKGLQVACDRIRMAAQANGLALGRDDSRADGRLPDRGTSNRD